MYKNKNVKYKKFRKKFCIISKVYNKYIVKFKIKIIVKSNFRNKYNVNNSKK